MKTEKKVLEITGRPMVPLVLGYPALIYEEDGLRKTTPVLSLETSSQTEIRFETLNTQYTLHIPQRGGVA